MRLPGSVLCKQFLNLPNPTMPGSQDPRKGHPDLLAFVHGTGGPCAGIPWEKPPGSLSIQAHLIRYKTRWQVYKRRQGPRGLHQSGDSILVHFIAFRVATSPS
jgi:hypothetical protein